jgi:hypothetical protein
MMRAHASGGRFTRDKTRDATRVAVVSDDSAAHLLQLLCYDSELSTHSCCLLGPSAPTRDPGRRPTPVGSREKVRVVDDCLVKRSLRQPGDRGRLLGGLQA